MAREGERPREPPPATAPRENGAIFFCLAQRRREVFSHKGRKGNKGLGMRKAQRLSLVARRLSPAVAVFFMQRRKDGLPLLSENGCLEEEIKYLFRKLTNLG